MCSLHPSQQLLHQAEEMGIPIFVLSLRALLAALTTGLGGILLCLIGKVSDKTMGCSISLTAGLMGGCSTLMFVGSVTRADSWPIFTAIFSTLLGLLSVHLIAMRLDSQEDVTFLSLKGRNAARAIIILLSMCIHSVGEGISIAVSSSADADRLGLYVLISLAIHNIPEGVAVAMMMINKGLSAPQASMCAVLSNLPQPLIALPAYVFLEYYKRYVPFGLGFSSGAMLYVVLHELIPEAKEKASDLRVWFITCSAAGAVVAMFTN